MMSIAEPINVWVYFNNQPRPYLFFWKNRPFSVDKVDLVSTNEGSSSLFYHFKVLSGNYVYYLKFDPATLKWFLEAID